VACHVGCVSIPQAGLDILKVAAPAMAAAQVAGVSIPQAGLDILKALPPNVVFGVSVTGFQSRKQD